MNITLQLMSVMSGCVVGCQNSNVLPKKVRELTEEADLELKALEAELALLGV